MTDRERLGQTVSKEWAASLLDCRGPHSTLPSIPAWQDMPAAGRESFCRIAEAVLREHAASAPPDALRDECLEHLQRSELCESVTLPREYWREFLGRVVNAIRPALPPELEKIRARRQTVPGSLTAKSVMLESGQCFRIDDAQGRLIAHYLSERHAEFFANAPDDIDHLLDYAAARDAELAAWKSQFGTSQLSHAIAERDEYRANVSRQEARIAELLKALAMTLPFREFSDSWHDTQNTEVVAFREAREAALASPLGRTPPPGG